MIPDYETLMLPLCKLASQNDNLAVSDATNLLCDEFNLTEEEREARNPGGSRTIRNRTGWARTFLKKAGLIEYPRRGHMRLTDRGRAVLAKNPTRISTADLNQYAEFVKFKTTRKQPRETSVTPETDGATTPEEQLESAHNKIRVDLESEILQQIKESTPAYFEKLVVDLLLKMGYGGSREDAGRAVGKSHDGGIDGIIHEDRLGLDSIYLQAKKWEGTVGRPEIQKFCGALQGRRAKKGVFITTSNFSTDAEEYVKNIDNKIVLIDGPRLAELMVDFDLGVTLLTTYKIKRIDNDYFVEQLGDDGGSTVNMTNRYSRRASEAIRASLANLLVLDRGSSRPTTRNSEKRAPLQHQAHAKL